MRWQSAFVFSCTEIPCRNLDVGRALPVERDDTFCRFQRGACGASHVGNIPLYFIPYLYRHHYCGEAPGAVRRGACRRRHLQTGGYKGDGVFPFGQAVAVRCLIVVAGCQCQSCSKASYCF